MEMGLDILLTAFAISYVSAQCENELFIIFIENAEGHKSKDV